MTENFDLVVLGGGTGGYAAAFRADELGMKVAIVERDKLGGTCLHRGCVPTKSYLHTAELLETMKSAPKFGLHFTDSTVDWQEVVKAKNEIVADIYSALKGLAKAHRVALIDGEGVLSPEDGLVVDGPEPRRLMFRNLVLATGSHPKTPPAINVDGERVITSDQALDLNQVPTSVVILGGGYVGVEFASMWRSFGAEVSIIEMTPRLMPTEDVEISTVLAEALKARGINLYLGSRLESLETNGGLTVRMESGGTTRYLEADQLMAAVGRAANIEGFEAVGIGVEAGFVRVNDRLNTSRGDVYAVGDLLPTPQLAHTAFAEGIFAAEEIAGLNPAPIDYNAVPHCVYSYPEVATVGLTEEAAVAQGYEVVVARLPFQINSRAGIVGETTGKVKLVGDIDGRILGVHMIGAKVTEMISEAMLMIGWQADSADVAGFIHPHPTFSEAIGEGTLRLAGKPLHSL